MKATIRVVSTEARQLHEEAFVIDLHVDTLFIQRLFGYNPARRHKPPIPYSPFFNHADIPRMIEGSINGVGLGVVLAPFLTSSRHRARVVAKTVNQLLKLESRTKRIRLVRTAEDFHQARRKGQGIHRPPCGEDQPMVGAGFESGSCLPNRAARAETERDLGELRGYGR